MRPIVVMATTAAHRWRQESEECSREFSLALTQNLLTHIHDTHVMMKICAHIAAQGHTHTPDYRLIYCHSLNWVSSSTS